MINSDNGRKNNKYMEIIKVKVTKERKNKVISLLLKKYMHSGYFFPTIDKFIEYYRDECYKYTGMRLTKNLLLNKYSHLFILGRKGSIYKIYIP